MRAVRCEGREVRVMNLPAPSGPGVRVRVKAAGVCGSDLHMLGQIQGITLGHEIAGITDDGTPVAVEPIAPCGKCGPCVEGDYNLCVDGIGMLHGAGRDGGMADEILVSPSAIVPLPSGLPLRDASLVEPLAVMVYALRRVGFRSTQRVAVIGGGTIGLCAVAAIRASGAEVALVARYDAQREAGERLGAKQASGQYDLVVEAAGSESALAQAIELAKPGGKVSVPGIYWNPVMLPGLAMVTKQVDLLPSLFYARGGVSRDFDVAATTLAATPELARSIITHRFPLDAAPEAFAAAASRESGAIKVVLEP